MTHIHISTDKFGLKKEEVCFMKFLKEHRLLSFAVISFVVLTGVNFFMIFELIKIIERI